MNTKVYRSCNHLLRENERLRAEVAQLLWALSMMAFLLIAVTFLYLGK